MTKPSVIDAMAATLSPETLADLLTLRDALGAANPKGGVRGALVQTFAASKGCSVQTAYRWLKENVGWAPERKLRADAGKTRCPDETLHFIASSINASVRNTGVSTKPICVAMNIAAQNGMVVNVTAGRINTLLRAKKLDVKTQANARNHQRQRSLYPNHVHQIDPSLCLIYYMGGKQYVIREEEFNKNKPVAIERIKLKVWRYVRYDHASGCIDCRYFEAAGENQQSLFDFLLYTWGKSAKRVSHGVPKMLLWDKGSANTSAGIRRLLDALGVHHETHATHHAWVKGGVENANWIVERHFESRLRDEPVSTIEQLNASAENWVRDYNANVLLHIEASVQRDDGQRHVRDDLWNLIAHTPEALIEMPAPVVCRHFMRGKEDTRQIRDGHITYVHPQSGKSELYSLQAWAKDFANGQKVRVSPMLLGDRVLRVEIDRYGQDPLHVDVTPETEFDGFGRTMTATVLGVERKSAPHTAAMEASKIIAKTAFGADASLADAEAKRAKNARPFAHFNEGKGIVAHSHLGQTELPPRLLPEPQAIKTIDMAAVRAAQAVRTLTQFEAAQALVARGMTLNAELVATLKTQYPDGVPEDQLDALHARLTVRGGLRVVNGGAV
ncbi:MAG: transposase [Rhodoferax sp.]|nr:transposase [Rhodoferax sp.]